MAKSRTKIAVTTVAIGLALNLILGTAKLVVGLIFHTSSITADAVNNYSDAAVSIITIIALALAAKQADREHPFGHGRFEYIATLIIGMVVFFAGAQLFISNIELIITPKESEFSFISVGILSASIAVKLFMGIFYKVRAKSTDSEAIRAAQVDCFSDCAVTTVVLVCLLIDEYAFVNIDAYAGLAVSLVVLANACIIIRDTVNRLVGTRSDSALESKIYNLVKLEPAVLGTHDLIIHDYGVENKAATVHIELDKNMTLTEAHDIADSLEDKAEDSLGIKLVVHCDPIDTSDPIKNRAAHAIYDALRPYKSTFHDLSLHRDSKRLSVDIRISESKRKKLDFIKYTLESEIRRVVGDFDIIINFDFD